jgi:hypothetical protein
MVCGTPGRGGAGGPSAAAILVGGSALPPGSSSVRASAPAGASSTSSAPLIGGANTVAGTGTDCPSPESLTVFPAQLPSPAAGRSEGRR